jgi:hypothetical protein
MRPGKRNFSGKEVKDGVFAAGRVRVLDVGHLQLAGDEADDAADGVAAIYRFAAVGQVDPVADSGRANLQLLKKIVGSHHRRGESF